MGAGGYVCLALALLGLGFGLYQWYSGRRTLRRLDEMLSAAVDGSFRENAFDESVPSSLEAKLARFLNGSASSTRNLEREREVVQTLISDISHQTKTPVANILLYASLLAEGDLPPEQTAQAATLCQQAEKLAFLIEGLVKASRLETGILTTAPEAGSVGGLLEDAARQAAPAAEKKNICLEVVLFSGQARFDKKWTGEALYNLVDNAAKFAPEGSTITVQISKKDGKAYTTVQNLGATIPPDELPLLFDRFHKADYSRSMDREGVGLGLYIVKTILNKLKENINVTSEDGVTRFTFTLTLA